MGNKTLHCKYQLYVLHGDDQSSLEMLPAILLAGTGPQKLPQRSKKIPHADSSLHDLIYIPHPQALSLSPVSWEIEGGPGDDAIAIHLG